MKSRRLTASACLLGATLALALAVAGRRGEATVRPMRWDPPPPPEPVLVLDNPLQVDPHLQRLGKGSAGGLVGEMVSASLLATLCGDGDGCELRLILQDTGVYSSSFRSAVGLLVTDATAAEWRFDAYTTLANDTIGFNGNATSQQLTGASTPDLTCSLVDDDPAGSYRLRLAGSGAAGCLLRVTD